MTESNDPDQDIRTETNGDPGSETTESEVLMVDSVDYWRCEDKRPHKWLYLGKKAQSYRCENCLQKVSKAELKEETDNA